MDKNTIIGFVLIGIVLFGFSWLNRPTPEQIEAQRRYQDPDRTGKAGSYRKAES